MNSTVIYCRTASIGKYWDNGKSRLDFLQRYALDNGFDSFESYYEWNVSGSTLNRPLMQKLISDVKAGDVKRVIVKDISQLTRKNTLLCDLFRLFREHGVELISVNNGGTVDMSFALNIESAILIYFKQSHKAG